MVRAARRARDGLFAAWRRKQQSAARPRACAYRCRAWLFACGNRIGLGHPQRKCYRNSRIWLRGAREGERRRALTYPHATGTSDTGCRISLARPVGFVALRRSRRQSCVVQTIIVGDSFLLNEATRNQSIQSAHERLAYLKPSHVEVAALFQRGELSSKKDPAI